MALRTRSGFGSVAIPVKPRLALNSVFQIHQFNMPKELTAEDVSSLQYFWEEKGDPERFCYFKDLLEDIKTKTPQFYAAWMNYKEAIRRMDEAAKNISEEANLEDEEE